MATLEELTSKVTTQFDEQTKAIQTLTTSVAAIVDTQAKLAKSIADQPPIYPADFNPNTQRIAAVPKDSTEEGRFGGAIKSFGHFLQEVKLCQNKNAPTETLRKAYQWYENWGAQNSIDKAIVGSNESFGSDGGFLVPPEYSRQVFARVYDPTNLVARTDNYTVQGNNMIFPRSSETSRATGSRWGGVQVYWQPEGGQGTVTKPGFGTLSLKLNKLFALGAITDELMNDQAVMPTYMLRAFSDEISFMITDSIVRGTGAGQPEGVLNAACAVTVDKEAGQLAATINTQNIVKMYARLWARSVPNAVWLYNQDCFPQLATLTLGIGTAGVTTYMPPGGLSGKPYSTLLGLPMFPIEQASTLGTVGDLILVDLSQYVTIGKGGPMSAQSMHFYFDTDQQAFRVTFRFDGKPWWPAALTPYKGSNSQSCIVLLATRS